jgi:hypothetical protein
MVTNWQQNTPYPSTRAVHTDTTGLPWRLDFVPGGFPRPNDAHQAIDGQSPAPDPTLYTSYRCLCST